MNNNWKNYLEETYFIPGNKAAFTGTNALYKILKDEGFTVGRRKIKQWLQNVEAYSLLRPVKHKFIRNRVVPAKRGFLLDVDLADVSNLSSHNDGIKFWLIVIDVFSKYLWVRPLKDKKHDSVVTAMNEILNEQPNNIRTVRSDGGSEFNNRWFKKLLKDNDIYFQTSRNTTKANFAERVIRTLKTVLYRYFNYKQTYKYVDILQDLISSYNNKPHKSILYRTPASIQEKDSLLWKSIYIDVLKNKKVIKRERPSKLSKPRPFRLKVGDYVRLSYIKHPFDRTYQQRWTNEIFVIVGRYRSQNVNLYKVNDWAGEVVTGTWYYSELQKVAVTQDQFWKIDKILKTRKFRGRKQHLVSYVGWPSKYNSWVNAKDIKDI